MPSERVINFAAGPSKVPTEVLSQAKEELLDYQGEGMSVMELSHRSATFTKIMENAEKDLRDILNVPSNYKILFMHGGGTAQFAAIPLNICQEGGVVDYFVTGSWSAKAAKEAEKYCKVNRVLPKTDKYVGIADKSSWKFSNGASYVYYCDNETIHGVEFNSIPEVPSGTTLVCDMSSNFLTKPVDVAKYGVIFAGAQKNIGIAGVTVVIIRDDLIGKACSVCPSILDYKVINDNKSLYNTPATFSMYLCGLVLKWVKNKGGIEIMQKNSITKSQMIYKTIEESNKFYLSPVEHSVRSRMTIPFRLGGPDGNDKLEKKFLTAAQEKGLVNLKGHSPINVQEFIEFQLRILMDLSSIMWEERCLQLEPGRHSIKVMWNIVEDRPQLFPNMLSTRRLRHYGTTHEYCIILPHLPDQKLLNLCRFFFMKIWQLIKEKTSYIKTFGTLICIIKLGIVKVKFCTIDGATLDVAIE